MDTDISHLSKQDKYNVNIIKANKEELYEDEENKSANKDEEK